MLPKSVRIGAHVYRVRTSTRKDLGPEVSGDVDNERNLIRVIRHATRSRKIEILIHECLHAMLTGHNFPNEEEIIVILGEAFTQFIADNPYFITEAVRVLSERRKTRKTS